MSGLVLTSKGEVVCSTCRKVLVKVKLHRWTPVSGHRCSRLRLAVVKVRARARERAGRWDSWYESHLP